MIRVCCRCPEDLNFLGIVEPFNSAATTHGLCRYHELQTLHDGRLATRAEEQEYYRLVKRRRKEAKVR